MYHAFFPVFSSIRFIEHITDPTLKANAILEIGVHLKKWLVVLKKASANDIGALTDNNVKQLLYVKESLLQIDKVGFRSLHDQIFKNLLNLNRKPLTLSTELFGEFIKGITYFENQQKATQFPIYHRLMACGPGNPGTEAFRIEFNQCSSKMDTAKRVDVKKRVETCYIERLIYNEIFKYVELFIPGEERSQNKSHLWWLDLTKGDFATCFPDVDISVSVAFSKHLRVSKPVTVTITRKIKGSHTSTTTFKKTTDVQHDGTILYEPGVECIKTLTNVNGKTSEYFKMQLFDMETKNWKQTY